MEVAETEAGSDRNPIDYHQIKVLPDPEEHQELAWLKKEEVEQSRCGDVDFEFSPPADNELSC